MTPLNLQIEEPGDMPFVDEVFAIAKTALESGREELVKSAAQDIAKLLPENDPDLTLRGDFDWFCGIMAEQIPYDHENIISVVMLLELVHKSESFTAEKTSYPSPPEGNTQDLGWLYYGLGLTLGESWNSIWNCSRTVEERAKWASYHAFTAHLELRGMLYPAYDAVTTLRSVLEEKIDALGIGDPFIEDLALAAAQHIHIAGHTVLRQLLDESVQEGSWSACEAFTKTKGNPRSLDRWRFWQKHLRRIGEGKYHRHGRQRTSDKNREFIRRAADSMTAIEEEVSSAEKPMSKLAPGQSTTESAPKLAA